LKYHIYLALLFLILFSVGWIFIAKADTKLVFSDYAFTISFIFIVSQTALWLFFKGLQKSPGKGVLYTLSGISAKFILYLIYLVVYSAVTKNLTLDYIIAFFVLYLAFTFFVLIVMVKTLKNKQL
jgi:hypothetical protein